MADLLLKSPLQYEIMLTNRWILRFPSDVGIQTWSLISCGSPKMSLQKIDIAFLNTKTYVNGSYEWKEMAIKVRDFVAPSQGEALMEWVRLHAESATGRMGYNIGCAKNLELELLDPTGVAVSKWLIENAIVTGELDFGEFSYGDAKVREISFTIQPQRCLRLY
jgi:hypothetical protein